MRRWQHVCSWCNRGDNVGSCTCVGNRQHRLCGYCSRTARDLSWYRGCLYRSDDDFQNNLAGNPILKMPWAAQVRRFEPFWQSCKLLKLSETWKEGLWCSLNLCNRESQTRHVPFRRERSSLSSCISSHSPSAGRYMRQVYRKRWEHGKRVAMQ